jgi:hypothetical protein
MQSSCRWFAVCNSNIDYSLFTFHFPLQTLTCIILLARSLARCLLPKPQGNFPESIKIDGCCAPTVSADEILAAAASGSGSGHGHGASANAAANASAIEWFPLLGRSRMRPDSEVKAGAVQ